MTYLKRTKGFTLIELLLVISIIALLTSLVLVLLSGARAQGRDSKRKAETDSLRKALALYYADYGTYPETTGWVSVEDTGNAEAVALRNALSPYLPTPPTDPLFGAEKSAGVPFSYQYMGTTTDSGDIVYKIHAELETGTYASYESFSDGGEGIVYGGGGGGGGAGSLPSGFALQFDGLDDFVEVPDESGALNITNTLSLEAWIKPNTTGAADNWRTVVGKQVGDAASNNEGYSLFVDESQNTVYFHVSMAQGHIYVGYTLPSLDTWYHVVGTFQPGPVMNLYVNGELKNNIPLTYGSGPFTGQIGSSSRFLSIGGDSLNDSLAPREFDGSVDEVRIYNRILSAVEAEEHYQGTFSDESGLAGRWSFEEGLGTTVSDISGNGNSGILFNPPSNYALQFNGTTGYVNVAGSDSLNLTSEVTIEAWVKRNSFSALDYMTIVEKQTSASEAYTLFTSPAQDSIIFAIPQGLAAYMEYNSPTTIGEWQHIVATYSGSAIAMYVNYGLNGSSPLTGQITTSTSPLFIGGDPLNKNWSTSEFDGIINDMRIYAKALPASVVKKHFEGDYSIDNTGCGGNCDLRTYWKFDEGAGTSTVDSSGNSNNGTILNDAQWVDVSSLNSPQWFSH